MGPCRGPWLRFYPAPPRHSSILHFGFRISNVVALKMPEVFLSEVFAGLYIVCCTSQRWVMPNFQLLKSGATEQNGGEQWTDDDIFVVAVALLEPALFAAVVRETQPSSLFASAPAK